MQFSLKRNFLAVCTLFVLMVFATSVQADDEWYSGGTLHQSSGLDWQEAGERNKLATCADFVATAWSKKLLNNEIMQKIATPDDIRPYAEELVIGLNKAFEKDDDPEKNKSMFTNQKVGETAAILMVMMDWLVK